MWRLLDASDIKWISVISAALKGCDFDCVWLHLYNTCQLLVLRG